MSTREGRIDEVARGTAQVFLMLALIALVAFGVAAIVNTAINSESVLPMRRPFGLPPGAPLPILQQVHEPHMHCGGNIWPAPEDQVTGRIKIGNRIFAIHGKETKP